MNYELANELKKSGFPQKGDSLYAYIPIEVGFGMAGTLNGESDWRDNIGKVYIPTLSELMEACGSRIHAMFRIVHTREAKSGKRWKITGKNTKTTQFIVYGSTAEEGVANLWLALNEKK